MRITTSEAARLPWVTRLDQTQACNGYRWSHMPGKALRNPELMAAYQCRCRARWQFAALREVPYPATDGTYCWSHLLVQLDRMHETSRTEHELTAIREQETGS
jgi:hypothetical protein